MVKVAVVRGERNFDPVYTALNLIEYKRALKGYDRVLIKVNFITKKTWDTGATTDPLVVEAIIHRLKKIPVEVKTTFVSMETKDLLQHRPTYIEQLGMYCAMVNAHEGEIIVYLRQEEESPPAALLLVYHVTFPNLEAIRDEMAEAGHLNTSTHFK